jgi:hypothetical protein
MKTLTPIQKKYVEEWLKVLPAMWRVSKGVSKNVFIPNFDCSLFASHKSDEFCKNNMPTEEMIKKYS